MASLFNVENEWTWSIHHQHLAIFSDKPIYIYEKFQGSNVVTLLQLLLCALFWLCSWTQSRLKACWSKMLPWTSSDMLELYTNVCWTVLSLNIYIYIDSIGDSSPNLLKLLLRKLLYHALHTTLPPPLAATNANTWKQKQPNIVRHARN